MHAQTADPLLHPSRAVDRRRHQRVATALLGRYMLASRREYPCQSLDASPGGVSLVAPVRGLIGERIVVLLEHVGRLEGQIVRHTSLGLAFAIQAGPRRRETLAAQLTWLANRHSLGLQDERRHERIVPRHRAVAVAVEGTRTLTGRLIDVSLSGAAVSLSERPPLGSPITLGTTSSRIVRHFEGGVAVEFLDPLSPDGFDEAVIL